LVKKSEFIGYQPKFIHELKQMRNLYGTFGKMKMKWNNVKHRSHIFMYKSWEKSMSLRYWIDAAFIIIIS
jgi:hypothetical protein